MQLQPGVTADEAIKALDELTRGSLNDIQNKIPHLTSGDFEQLIFALIPAYDGWTDDVSRELRKVFADAEVLARLHGGRYPFIVAGTQNPVRTSQLLYSELGSLRTFFTLVVANALREQQERFKHHQGRSLVLDSNDCLHYARFDKIPWAREYGAGTVVVFPHVIVDEIDAKAYSTGSDKIRRRARGVYSLLERLHEQIDDHGYATLDDGTKVEILTDKPGHLRLPNNDNEAVASAALLQQALAQGQVTVLTRDIGVRARARAWNLKAEELPQKYLIREDRLSRADVAADVAAITVSEEAPEAPAS